MSFLSVYLIGLAGVLGLMTVLWLISLAIKNSSIVDIFWGAGFVLVGWLYYFLAPEGFIVRKLLIAALATIWGLRLSIHIFLRNKGKPEDFRYQKWRKENGAKWWWKSFFQVFLLQGLLMWFISMPLLAAQYFGGVDRLTVFDYMGIVLWAIGFLFEAGGDLQLAQFLKDPANRGTVMRSGVWRYTRHPNYFGDSAQWWGFYLIALAAGGWWTILSPVVMTYLLTKVSGVALLEKTMSTRPGYREYAEVTSAFIPWFPRKRHTGDTSQS
jgi:steroid 5-alpha reductase family enzyme